MAKGDSKASLSHKFSKNGLSSADPSPSSSSAVASPSLTLVKASSSPKRSYVKSADAFAAKPEAFVAEPERISTGLDAPLPASRDSLRNGADYVYLLPRNRSESLSERSAAVLRALQRAPEDKSLDDLTPSHSLTPHHEREDVGEDDEYTSEGLSNTSSRLCTPPDAAAGAAAGGVSADVSRVGSVVGLSGKKKHSGRINRQGLRKRGEAKEVEKMMGRPKAAHKREGNGDGKKSWEIPRKIFHSSHGFLVLYLYLSHHNLGAIVRGLSVFLVIVVTADVIRLNNAGFEKVYETVLGFLMREAEKEKVNGVVWYLIGVIFSLHFYPADIACVSVMILSWADTAASVFGRLFGRYTPALPSPPFASRKSLSGFLAALIAGAGVALLFWGTNIAKSAERFDGLSWSEEQSILGTTAPGWQNSGWCGWNWGFRGRLPSDLIDSGRHGTLNAAWNAASQATSSLAHAAAADSVSASAPGMPLPVLALGAGLVAAVAEGLELGGLDDNFSLPILSGLGLWAWLFGWGKLAVAYTRAGNSILMTE